MVFVALDHPWGHDLLFLPSGAKKASDYPFFRDPDRSVSEVFAGNYPENCAIVPVRPTDDIALRITGEYSAITAEDRHRSQALVFEDSGAEKWGCSPSGGQHQSGCVLGPDSPIMRLQQDSTDETQECYDPKPRVYVSTTAGQYGTIGADNHLEDRTTAGKTEQNPLFPEGTIPTHTPGVLHPAHVAHHDSRSKNPSGSSPAPGLLTCRTS
jgi:hypothetical protein